MNTQQQKVEEEKIGHHGGDSEGRLCWRCALVKAIKMGATTALYSFIKNAIDPTVVELVRRKLSLPKKEMAEVADMIHEVVVYIDGFSGRSEEVN